MSDRLDVLNLKPGTVLLDKFRVVKTLGVGGMGVVVAAEHISLGNMVAIKMMLPTLVSNESVVKRFLLEAKAATRISSEHVARVLDVGSLTGHEGLPPEGLPYMVMEHLEGKDLSEWVKMGKKFPVTEAIGHIVEACEALAQAHKVGIIHRDIKPANLFLVERDDRSHVKVLDFGISKLLEEQPMEMGLTKTTTVLGSGLYMSPEQMRSAKSVDFRTDIYSLGVCLYELLSGTQPHTAESFSELCVKVNVDPPTPLRTYRPDISDELAEVIAKAYARDMDERYQTVQELALALAPYAEVAVGPTIDRIQGITRHSSLLPPPPSPDASGALRPPAAPELQVMPEPQLARTAAAVTTPATAETKPRGNVGMVVTAAIIALAIAAGTGLFLIQRRGGFGPATTDPTSTSVTDTDSAPATTTTESADTTSETTESTAEQPADAGPATSASAEASASATTTTTPPATTRAPPTATKTTTRPRTFPTAKPVKKCNRINPETMLMEQVPCP